MDTKGKEEKRGRYRITGLADCRRSLKASDSVIYKEGDFVKYPESFILQVRQTMTLVFASLLNRVFLFEQIRIQFIFPRLHSLGFLSGRCALYGKSAILVPVDMVFLTRTGPSPSMYLKFRVQDATALSRMSSHM
jgi:hypothetical protein